MAEAILAVPVGDPVLAVVLLDELPLEALALLDDRAAVRALGAGRRLAGIPQLERHEDRGDEEEDPEDGCEDVPGVPPLCSGWRTVRHRRPQSRRVRRATVGPEVTDPRA